MKIGFDLWETLIKANPMFKERRKDLFDRYQMGSHDIAESLMGQIKSDLNSIIEDTGWQPNMTLICTLFASRFGKSVEDMHRFYNDYQLLCQLYPPILIGGQETKDLLKSMENAFGQLNELHIVSNTMFINGQSLRDILHNNIDIGQYFEYMYFSDIRMGSKPGTKISDTKLDYFIGDNPKTDGVYASKVGATYLQINSNDKTLKDVYNIIIAASR